MNVGGFDAQYVPQLLAVEDRHFWFRARRRIITALAEQATDGLKPGYLVLDVGCGTGSTLSALQRACPNGRVVGVDSLFETLPHARRRTTRPVLQADVLALPFVSQARFQLIGLFDVLEHVPDDGLALTKLRELLAPGGVLLVTVPAGPELWSYFDEAAQHCRRYTAVELSSRLSKAGYKVEYITPFMRVLYPFLRIARRWVRVAGGRQPSSLPDLRVIPLVNSLFTWLLSQEARVIVARRTLPFGTSIVALARRQ